MTITISLKEMRDLVAESKSRPCVTCGLTKALNPHTMCARKVAVLDVLGRFKLAGDEWVRVEPGRELQGETSENRVESAYRADQHAMRAVWFGLARWRGKRSAQYQITNDGVAFLKGRLDIPRRILCYKGDVIYESAERVYLPGVKRIDLDRDYWDRYPWADERDRSGMLPLDFSVTNES